MPIEEKKCNKNRSIYYKDHRTEKKHCWEIYNTNDLDDIYQKQTKISQIISDLHEQHDSLISSGSERGDDELDEVDEKLEAALQEYLNIQIEIDQNCEMAQTKDKCGPSCQWLEKKFTWYQFFYSAKGYCVSKAKAQILKEQYMEGAEQLQEIAERLQVLQNKKKLTAREKESLKYLKHLRREVEGLVDQDQTTIKDLAASLLLLQAYEKLHDACRKGRLVGKCSKEDLNSYQSRVDEIKDRITKLQAAQRSKRVKWTLVTAIASAMIAIYVVMFKSTFPADSLMTKIQDQSQSSVTELTQFITNSVTTMAYKIQDIWKAIVKCGTKLLNDVTQANSLNDLYKNLTELGTCLLK